MICGTGAYNERWGWAYNIFFFFAEEMCHIDDIPKIAGVLEEFIPGQNGCEVFKK